MAEDTKHLNDVSEFQKLNDNKHIQIVSGLNRPLKTKPLGEQTRAVRRQTLMVILGNIGVLSSGMALGLPAVTLEQLKDPLEMVHLTASQASWYASINIVSCPLGGLLSSYILDKLGRKKTLYILNILSLIAWALMALAIQEDADAVATQLMISRFIIGISIGLSSAPVGVYSAEISLPKIRGGLILATSISIAAGITFIYFLGYFIRNDWHLIAYICCAYQIISLLCVIPMPETPSWLISKGRIAEAKKSLNFFRGLEKSAVIINPEVAAEFNVIEKSIHLNEGEKKPSLLSLIRLPEVYKPLLILMGLFAFQQMTGIFVVIVYAVEISMKAGVQIDPFMCAILIGMARLVTTCPMVYILEKWGRRRSGIISAIGMTICMFILAGCGWSQWLHSIPYLPVIAIVGFIVLSTLGIFTLPFFMISELFPQKVRGPASGFTIAVGTFIGFLCIKTYPAMDALVGTEFCFVIYGTVSFMSFIFVYVALPETRGRTLLEIEERFRNKKNQNIRSGGAGVEVEMQAVLVK